MGIKNEMQLFVSYNHGKEKVMKEVLGFMERLDQGLQIQETAQGSSQNNSQQRVEQISEKLQKMKEKESFKARFKHIPKIDTPTSPNLRQTRTFKESNEFRKRKMSSGCFDLASANSQ